MKKLLSLLMVFSVIVSTFTTVPVFATEASPENSGSVIESSSKTEVLDEGTMVSTDDYLLYILENLNPEYIQNPEYTNEASAVLTAKNTYVEKSVLEEGQYTLSSYFDALSNDEGLLGYIMTSVSSVKLYDIDKNSEYVVGYLNNDINNDIKDIVFAENNDNAVILTGEKYDFNTGLVYISKADLFKTAESGDIFINNVQAQLLRSYTDTNSEIAVQTEDETFVTSQSVTNASIEIPTTIESKENAEVYLNDSTEPISDEYIEISDGVMVIDATPANVNSIIIEEKSDIEVAFDEIFNSETNALSSTPATSVGTIYGDVGVGSAVKFDSKWGILGTSRATSDYDYNDTYNDVQVFHDATTTIEKEFYDDVIATYGQDAYNVGASYIDKGTDYVTYAINMSTATNFTGNANLKTWASGLKKTIDLSCIDVGTPAGTIDYAEYVNITACCIARTATTATISFVAKQAINDGGSHKQTMCGTFTVPLVCDGDLAVKKVSENPSITDGSACYSHEGTTFGIFDSFSKALSASEALENGTSAAEVLSSYALSSIVIDKNGDGKSEKLSAGTYYLFEVIAGKGYKLNNNIRSFTITNGSTTNIQIANEPASDPAYISITKDTKGKTVTSIASLEGTQFTICHYSNFYDTVDAAETAAKNGQCTKKTWIIEVKKENKGTIGYYSALGEDYLVSGSDTLLKNDPSDSYGVLPVGTVTIKETKAATGYTIKDGKYTDLGTSTEGTILTKVTQETDGGDAVLNVKNQFTADNSIILGGVSITKILTGDATGDLSGYEFNVTNKSGYDVIIDGTTFKDGEVVTKITTDKNGIAKTSSKYLPNGTYEVTEVIGDKEEVNYNKDFKYTFTVSEHGKMYGESDNAAKCTNSLKYGSINIIKKDSELSYVGDRMASFKNIQFEVINNNSYDITYYNSEGQGTVVKAGEKINFTGAGTLNGNLVITDKDILSGEAVVSTGEKSLPYGNYIVREKVTNEYYVLTDTTDHNVKIADETKAIETTFVNDPIRSSLKFTKTKGKMNFVGAYIPFAVTNETTGETHVVVTNLAGEFDSTSLDLTANTNSNDGLLTKSNIKTSDIVKNAGVWFGKGVGTNMSTATNERGAFTVGHYTVKELRCENNTYYNLEEFSFDVTKDGEIINIGNILNTLSYVPQPSVKTTLNNKEEINESTKNVYGDKLTTLVDTVEYKDLLGTYTATLSLYDKTAGKFVTDNGGNKVTASKELVLDKEDYPNSGTFEMEITVDLSSYKGHEIVAFEEIYEGADLVCEHKDPTDDNQTVYVLKPAISTKATGNEDHLITSSKAVFTDIVNFTDYISSEKTVRKSYLYDKTAGSVVTDSEQTEERIFSEDSIVVTWEVNTLSLGGHDIVACEEFYDKDDNLICSHTDVNDEDQTLHIAEVATSATNKSTSEKNILLENSTATVVDHVQMSNLVVGNVYTVRGSLMDKNSGEAITESGVAITASSEFAATSKDMTVDLEFSFNPTLASGKDIVVFEKLLLTDSDVEIASHENLEDSKQSMYIPEISTKATSDIGTHNLIANETSIITDEVSYSHLCAGESYTATATLVDKETGEPIVIGGKTITGSKSFIPVLKSGSVNVTLTFDSCDFEGRSFVVYETVTDQKGNIVAVHNDIDDEAQSIYVPHIETEATSSFGTHNISAEKKSTITDTVSYSGLAVGETYKITGILMNKDTGWPALSNKKQITAETSFVPTSTSGSVKVVFEYDGELSDTNTYVAFETLYDEYSNALASHEDIDDEAQTVKVPSIKTVASVERSGHNIFLNDVISDTITYNNLVIGDEYTFTGVLVNGVTGDYVKEDGKAVTSSVTFIADKESGEKVINFKLDSQKMNTPKYVVYETLLDSEENVLTAERDIDNIDQTIYAPELKTTALTENGTHNLKLSEETTITDTVTYEYLSAGETYILKGSVIDKLTGKEVEIDGVPVRNEVTFFADNTSGTVTNTFEFNSLKAPSTCYVIYEILYNTEGVAVGAHVDENDMKQSVYTPLIDTYATGDMDEKTVYLSEDAKITDKVSVSNLVPNQSYALVTQIVDKETGEIIGLKSYEILNPEVLENVSSSVEVNISAVFDSNDYEGKELVVYEYLYLVNENKEEILIAAHEDIEDADQTVKVMSVSKTEIDDVDVSTGDNTNKIILVVALVVIITTLSCVVGTIVAKYTKKKKEDE